jgi:hypothetical protein
MRSGPRPKRRHDWAIKRSDRLGRISNYAETANAAPRRHGNWVHGRYSKARIEGMQELRQLVRILRGAWWLSIPGTDRPKPIGWKAYRIGRPMKRSPMGHKGPREKSFMAAKEISWPR